MRRWLALLLAASVDLSAMVPASGACKGKHPGETDPVRTFLLLLSCFVPLTAAAVPPPPVQVTANCDAPTYASDFLVCKDADLMQLDGLLARVIGQRNEGSSELVGRESDQDWLRRSRLCAFEADHRGCLRAAYCARIALLSGGKAPPGCGD